jgi:hypothetical protein
MRGRNIQSKIWGELVEVAKHPVTHEVNTPQYTNITEQKVDFVLSVQKG